MSSTSTANDSSLARHAARHRSDFVFALLAATALLLFWILAMMPGEYSRADTLTAGVLALIAVIVCWTPLARHLELQENASVFVLTAAMFIVYSLARRAGPDDGFALTFPWLGLPDDQFVIPYAARIAVLGALLTARSWWRNMEGWTRALLLTAGLIMFLALIGFRLLAGFYTVGPVEQLDPTPLPYLAMQVIEYSCLALLCNVAVAHPTVRRWALRILPMMLLVLWARLQFVTPTSVDTGGAEEAIEGEGEFE